MTDLKKCPPSKVIMLRKAVLSVVRGALKQAGTPIQPRHEEYGVDISGRDFIVRANCTHLPESCIYCGRIAVTNPERELLQENTGYIHPHGAPNFWFMPTDFKIWWPEQIGSNFLINRQFEHADIEAIKNIDLSSLLPNDSRKFHTGNPTRDRIVHIINNHYDADMAATLSKELDDIAKRLAVPETIPEKPLPADIITHIDTIAGHIFAGRGAAGMKEYSTILKQKIMLPLEASIL